MKKILLSIMALFLASTAMADSYLYIDNDFAVKSNQLGRTITIPVKAHFDGRVSGFLVDMSYPEGLTPVSATAGSSLTLEYKDQNGESQNAIPYFGNNDELTRLMALYTISGYDYPEGSSTLESYGVVKMDAGDYDEMFLLSVQVAQDFAGGEITLATQVAAGADTRGGTVTDLGDDTLTISKTVNISVEPVDHNNYFVIDNTEVLHGENVQISVSMSNTDDITAFQADLYLPEGFVLVGEIEPSSRVGNHEFDTEVMSDGDVRIISYDENLSVFEGNEGEMFRFTVQAPDEEFGEFTIALRNCRMTTAVTFNELNCENAEGTINVLPYLMGDANDSHTVTVADVVATAQYILGRDVPVFQFGAADMNYDSEITVTDAVLIANKVLNPDSPTMMRAASPLIDNDDAMHADNLNLAVGQTGTVTIVLDNAIDYTAFQLDLMLPYGLTASNFALTDRAGSHALDMNELENGKLRLLCYSPQMTGIDGNDGALLTFNVTSIGNVDNVITVDGIEMVTTNCQTVKLDAFSIGVNNATAVSELTTDKPVDRVEYFNLAGQKIDRPANGVTIVVTTYTDGTRTSAKVIR